MSYMFQLKYSHFQADYKNKKFTAAWVWDVESNNVIWYTL